MPARSASTNGCSSESDACEACSAATVVVSAEEKERRGDSGEYAVAAGEVAADADLGDVAAAAAAARDAAAADAVGRARVEDTAAEEEDTGEVGDDADARSDSQDRADASDDEEEEASGGGETDIAALARPAGITPPHAPATWGAPPARRFASTNEMSQHCNVCFCGVSPFHPFNTPATILLTPATIAMLLQ